jgi:lipopolysaccharide export system permease protein|tara:strand:- start:39 stop:1085 length:1047 start_codon:yes stop_codon:yes gene_type:complete
MLKKYLIGFSLAITVLLGINLLLVFIAELKNIGSHQYTISVLFNYVIYLIPQNILDIFPYALLIGSMISFGSMAYHSEFVAINSHGIGIKKVIYLIIFQTFIISAMLTIIINLIAPKYSNEAQSLKNISLNKALSDKSLWFKSSNYIVNINKIITDKRLENIVIYNIRDGSLTSVISAEKGFYNQQWTLKNVEIHDTNLNKVSTEESYFLKSDDFVPSEILKSQFNKKRYISIQDLYRNINYHNTAGIPYENHKVIFWKKVLLPFSCCIIVFIGLPFLFTRMRSTNQSQRLIFGVLFGITYFVLTSIITNLSLIIGIPALASVLISMVLFIAIGIYLFNSLVKKDIPI